MTLTYQNRRLPGEKKNYQVPLKLFALFFSSQESILDASEDSQLRAAIAASLACTTSKKETETSSDDDDDDYEDLEFSGSDSDLSPQKKVAKTSVTSNVKKEVKRGINFDEASEKEAGDKEIKSPQTELLNSNTKDEKSKGGSPKISNNSSPKISNNTAERNEVQVREDDSIKEDKSDSDNQRTQQQAGE